MAHRIKVEIRPHRNKGTGRKSQGELSATKKDYVVIDRHRGKRIVVGVASSMKATEPIIEQYRREQFALHRKNHPNDRAFNEKHKETSDV